MLYCRKAGFGEKKGVFVRRSSIFALVSVVLALVIIRCGGIGGQSTKPTVIIASPPSGSVYTLGEEVFIQSTATDPSGVTEVALLVDGNVVRTDPSPVSQGQAQFSLIQSWIAESVGQHTLTVQAKNSQGATSESGILITVREQSVNPQPPTVVAIATAVPLATATPQSTGAPQTDVPTVNPIVTVIVTATAPPVTNAPPPTAPPTCVISSRFVADVTIPDGTVFTPNAVFTKTWRVQNNGTCAWENTGIAFVNGTQMAASGLYPVPVTQPGQTADLVVPMAAPANYGAYQATWRMRSPDGQLFGTNLTVVINVPAPATAVPPTKTNVPATAVPTPSGCSGQPNDYSFKVNGADEVSITSGQSVTLSWNAVTNASEVRLDGGEFSNEGVAAPGNRVVSPNATTTYTLKAKCNNGGGTRDKSVKVNVNAPVSNFAGSWNHNFGTMVLAQEGANVSGSYTNAFSGEGEIDGTVTGNVLNGTWSINGGTGSLQFTVSNNNQTFNGNFGGTNQWCGARSGQSFPNGCAYDGNWRVKYGASNAECDMTLNQVGTQVTGAYCETRTVTGTVTFVGTELVLNGTWQISDSQTGPFVYYLTRWTSAQFRGNYEGNQWCGWRSSSSAPVPCQK